MDNKMCSQGYKYRVYALTESGKETLINYYKELSQVMFSCGQYSKKHMHDEIIIVDIDIDEEFYYKHMNI